MAGTKLRGHKKRNRKKVKEDDASSGKELYDIDEKLVPGGVFPNLVFKQLSSPCNDQNFTCEAQTLMIGEPWNKQVSPGELITAPRTTIRPRNPR